MLASASVCADYVPTYLGTLGGDESWALGVNKSGAVVGCSTDSNGRLRAFLWTVEGGMVDLGTLGGENAAAVGINDSGEIVGYSETADGARHAFLRTTEEEMVDLGVLPGDSASESAAVADLVVGTSTSAAGGARAFSWSVDTNMVPLVSPVSEGDTRAFGTNSASDIVGTANVNGNQRAVLWRADGTVHELGTLGGSTSSAYGVNNAGQVVGESDDGSGQARAFCWVEALGIQQLPSPRGTTSARACAVNNSYQVVGYAACPNKRAILWDLSRDMTRRVAASVTALPLPKGMVESEAASINDSGLIAGCCWSADGPKRAVLWRPVEDRRGVVSMALTGGLFVPVSSATRREFTNTWFRIALQPFERTRRTLPHFTAESAAYRLDGPTRARLYQITFGLEKGLEPGRIAQHYLAVRGGPYYGRLDEDETGRRERGWGLNLNAAYGLIFLRSLYAEVRFDYFSRFAGVDFSGVSLSVGFRLFDLPR